MASGVPLGLQDLLFILYFPPDLLGDLVLFQALGQKQTKVSPSHHALPVKRVSKHHGSTTMGVNSGGFGVGQGRDHLRMASGGFRARKMLIALRRR